MLKGIGVTPTARIRKPHFFTKRPTTATATATPSPSYSCRIPAYRSPRITINVSGMRYETFEETLANYPDSLLGSPAKRKPFYNALADEYYFQRDKHLFDAILFYYQSRGILAKPDGVEEELFMREVYFYGIQTEVEEVEEVEEEIVLPEHPIRRKLWLWFEYPRSSSIARGLALWSVFVISLSTVTFCIETIPSLKHLRLYEVDHFINLLYNKTVIRDHNNNTVIGANGTARAANGTAHLANGTAALNTTVVQGQHTTKHTVVVDNYFTDYWFVIEAFCVVWFTVEYLARLCSTPTMSLFVRSPMGLLDMVAIVPFYITLALKESTHDVRSFAVVRALRLFRVIRIFKLSRYSNALKLLVKTLYSSSEQLRSLFFCFLVTVVLFSSAIYYVDDRANIPSIPHAFWWTIITMTSVGYGDVVPTTIAGKLVGSVCAMCGLILFCLPTPVLVSNFIKYYLVAGATDKKKKIFAENLKAIFLRKLK